MISIKNRPTISLETLINGLRGMKSEAHHAQKARHITGIGEFSSTEQRSYSPAQPFNQRFPFLQSFWQWVTERKSTLRYLPVLSCTLLLSACIVGTPLVQEAEEQPAVVPTTEAEELKQIVSMHNRIDRVAGPLLFKNAAVCKKQVRNLLGFGAANKYTYSSFDPSLVARTMGLGERLQVTHIVPGSGAARAGLQRGDILLEINAKPIPQGPTAESETVRLLSPIVAKNKPVRLTVLRNARNHKLQIPLTTACGFRVELGYTDQVNAYSDGQRILITKGMLRFTKSDRELAYVISKEMAHNILGHTHLKNADAVKATIDNLMKADAKNDSVSTDIIPMPQKQDISGDTLGLVIAMRGGYDIDPAVSFWKRLANQYPVSVSGGYTELHPSTEARLESMTSSISKIKSAETKRKARRSR